MPSNKKTSVSVEKGAAIFRDMISIRRINWLDNQFPKMPEVWEFLAEDNPKTRLKFFEAETKQAAKKAGVVAFDDFITLTTARELWEFAKKGSLFHNFVLAHEFAHLALDHHASGAVIKNFELFDGQTGLANVPPTTEELEANLGAVFFQCGTTLLAPGLDPDRDALTLARRAHTDPQMVKKAIRICRLPQFTMELAKLKQNRPCVLL